MTELGLVIGIVIGYGMGATGGSRTPTLTPTPTSTPPALSRMEAEICYLIISDLWENTLSLPKENVINKLRGNLNPVEIEGVFIYLPRPPPETEVPIRFPYIRLSPIDFQDGFAVVVADKSDAPLVGIILEYRLKRTGTLGWRIVYSEVIGVH